MARCLFCGKEFKYEDVLFFKRIDQVVMSDDNSNSQTSWQSEEETAAENSENSKQPATEATEEESVSESGSSAGRWQPDEVYDTFLKNYLYMDQEKVYKKQNIFYVNWSSQESRKGCGKGKLEQDSYVPQRVQLCEDDIQALNNGLSGGIIIDSLTECCCPNCHVAFPQGYLNTREDHICRIGLIGGPRAGKTEYITAAYQNISSLFGMYNNMGTFEVTGMSERIAEFLSDCYIEYGHIPETPLKPILPLVFNYSRVDEDGQFKGYVVLYDIPGELFKRGHEDELQTFKGTLVLSDALMVLMDCGGQVFTALKEKSLIENDGQSCLEQIESVVKRYWENASQERAGKSLDAVAIVLSKFDKAVSHSTLLSNHKKSCTYCFEANDTKAHGTGNGVDMNTIASLNNEMKKIVGDKEISLASGIFDSIKSILSVDPKMFPVSTYQKTPTGYVKCTQPNSNRHRFLEPLLYIMAVKHLIPTIGGSINNVDWAEYLSRKERKKYDKLIDEIAEIKYTLDSEELSERKKNKYGDRLNALEYEKTQLEDSAKQKMHDANGRR